ncbi:hypothetical protein BN903_17 [Halorubrum sp. AJ67]|nr:hypothetical protein BN903_17 [Halorubrum sp. AJ67]
MGQHDLGVRRLRDRDYLVREPFRALLVLGTNRQYDCLDAHTRLSSPRDLKTSEF